MAKKIVQAPNRLSTSIAPKPFDWYMSADVPIWVGLKIHHLWVFATLPTADSIHLARQDWMILIKMLTNGLLRGDEFSRTFRPLALV
jgi:hypothetical protein